MHCVVQPLSLKDWFISNKNSGFFLPASGDSFFFIDMSVRDVCVNENGALGKGPALKKEIDYEKLLDSFMSP